MNFSQYYAQQQAQEAQRRYRQQAHAETQMAAARKEHQDALKAHNDFAARSGMGYDGAGRSVFAGGAGSMYASPSETANMRSQHSQHAGNVHVADSRFQQAATDYERTAGQYANHMEQGLNNEMSQRQMALQENEQAQRYGTERDRIKMQGNMFSGLAGGFGQAGMPQMQMPQTRLYDNAGRPIGGSLFRNLLD